MKIKVKILLKITALILCVVMMLPLTAACGEDGDENEQLTTGADEFLTDPPATKPIDPELPYYDYLDEEFARFGFTGGDRIAAETEEAVMEKLKPKGCARTLLDLSGEDVPFTFAYRYEVANMPEPAGWFWQITAETYFDGGKTITEGDVLAGCMYVRDGGGPNMSRFYLAIKTPTDKWASEGAMNVHSYSMADYGEGWHKIYFYGEFLNDENPASTAMFHVLLGFCLQTLDIGGIYIMRYPGTADNIEATFRMPR